MSVFKFDGNWETKINLSELSKMIHSDFLSTKLPAKVRKEVRMMIEDVKNLNPDPEKEQLNTINFLQNVDHQKEIVEATFIYIKEIAYPYFQSIFSKEEYSHNYPILNSSKDLFKAVGFSEVTVHDIFKDEFAFYTLSFYAPFANESQLNLTLHKARVIDHVEWHDFPSQGLIKELGMRNLNEEEYQELLEKEKKEVPIFHLPHPKYGLLKPWQKMANQSYPYNLLKKGEFEKLKSFIQSNGKDYEKLSARLLKTSINFKIQIPKELEDFLKSIS